MSTERILVIGVGNLDRGDDAIGPLIARQIKPSVRPGVSVLEHDGDGMAMAELWKEAGAVIVIDAADCAAEPGSIHRFDAAAAPLPTRTFGQSTHAFGLAEAIELSRALKQLPRTFIVYAVASRHFAIGTGLSSSAQQAAPHIADQVLVELSRIAPRLPEQTSRHAT